MPARKTTTRVAKRKPDTEGLLSHSEVDRLAERLAVDLEGDGTLIARAILLFDHLESLRKDPVMLDCAIFSIKQKLFTSTSASSDAQAQFEQKARQERGKLLRWPQPVK